MKIVLDITELAAGGDGVGHTPIDGERRAVFVPGAAVGDRMEVEIDPAKRPARGRVLSLLEASPTRVAPRCPHVDRCGGCDWMFLTSEEQARAHAAIVARVLPPSMKVDVRSHPVSTTFGYRWRARLHLDVGRSGKLAVGMFGRASREPVIVDACVVLHPTLEAARKKLDALVEGARGRGEASIALANDEGRSVLDLRWSGDLPAAVFARIEAATSGEDAWLSGARVFAGAVKTPAKIGDPTPWIRGADGGPLRLAPGGFSQASEEGNVTLVRHVAEAANAIGGAPPGSKGSDGAKTLELYAGAGNLTVLLARRLRVTSVETSREACDAARANLATRALEAKVVEGDAEATPIPDGTKLVVLDPPRTGARAVAERLAASKVPAVIYVSCDPPTLGRDLGILAQAGFEAKSVDTFEMFPQTSHVETVVVLERRRANRGRAP